MLDQLVNSDALKISRFPDFDHFRSIEKLGAASSIPLRWKDFNPCVAAVTLSSCSIYLQRTFPRILQAHYRSPGAIICLAMDDAVSAILDGVEARPPSLLLIKGVGGLRVGRAAGQHMGEFRAVYREIFGETPRQTLDGSGK